MNNVFTVLDDSNLKLLFVCFFIEVNKVKRWDLFVLINDNV